MKIILSTSETFKLGDSNNLSDYFPRYLHYEGTYWEDGKFKPVQVIEPLIYEQAQIDTLVAACTDKVIIMNGTAVKTYVKR